MSRISRIVFLIVLVLVCEAQAGEARRLRARILRDPARAARLSLFRQFAIEVTLAGDPEEGVSVFSALLRDKLRSGEREVTIRQTRYPDFLSAADAYTFLRMYARARAGSMWRPDVLNWLLESDNLLSLLLNTVDPRDDWPACLELIEDLYDHDPDGRGRFRNLILALGVVWDQPRSQLHRQTGKEPLPYLPEITERYDFFKELFLSRQAASSYRDLSVTALTFVVDTPVPVSELRWVRQHVKPRSWKQKFFDIEYAQDRILAEAYQWPYGVYSLAAIEKSGGICVDQAYYAVMCARAYGLPAVMFSGIGRRGPHAWFAYMKDVGKWEMDIGRYSRDRYATGHALRPQTNVPMTDHDLALMAARSRRTSRAERAARLARLSAMLLDLGYIRSSERVAKSSIAVNPLYEVAWSILAEVVARNEGEKGRLSVLERKADAFRDFPDQVARIRSRQADILRALGREDEAGRLLARQRASVSNTRDDLLRAIASEEVRLAYEQGRFKEAREKMEALMKRQRHEGQKVHALVEAYLDLTKQTGQTRQAARFLGTYLTRLARRSADVPRVRRAILLLLVRAYENDGDERKADRIKRKLKDL